MPYLGDYLGQLLSEISMARMQADLETLRIAELYAMQPLLRTMSVPRMRLPDVDIDIPILIKAVEDPRAGESARGGVKLSEIGGKFYEVLSVHLSKAGIALSSTDQKTVRTELDKRLKQTQVPVEILVDVFRVADDLTSTALRVIGELIREPSTTKIVISPKIAAELKDAVRLEFLKLRTSPPRLAVIVTSAEIREAGTSENVTRLRLKVSEQGFEWKVIELEGVQHDRLIPE
jgi:hypothetical protein